MAVLAKTTLLGPWSQVGIAVTMTPSAGGGGDSFVASGDMILIARNSGAVERTITITSVADPVTGRMGNVTAQALAAGEIRAFRLLPVGWSNAGSIAIATSHAEVIIGILQL
jgi:hypothetical protein